MEETLYSIGEVAELANISIQTLRYYDKIGLFKPAYVDSSTNYRYYRDAQLYHLDVIKSLKYIGTSLEDIKRAQQLKTEDLLIFLSNQEDIIDKKLKKLLDIQQTVRTIKDRMKKQLNGSTFGEVTIRYEEEMHIIQTDARGLTPIDILNASYSDLKKVVEQKELMMNNSYGAMIPFRTYKHEDDIVYTHIFMPTSSDEKKSMLPKRIEYTKIRAGKYVCISDWYSSEKYFTILQKLLGYIVQNDIQVTGCIYDVFTPIHYSPIEQEDYMNEMRIRIVE